MSFASPSFLWYFMPTVLGLYWIVPARFRNGLIAACSLVFYTWGAGKFVLLLLACIGYNYAAGLVLDSQWAKARPGLRRGVLIATITAELAVLAWWKYAAFGSGQFHRLFDEVPVMRIALPIGISFFTFHDLSYVIDVYRGERRAQRSPIRFAMYIAMFPQLIAGPIVRYREISDQLVQATRNKAADLAEGFPRFALGLTKKVVVADSIAPIVRVVFADPGQLDFRTAWIGAVAYTLQIYFDFSGYSDMALGLARMFGLRFPENFDRPYSAVSITDFWRRWHMSLSRWFRDYVYFSLGGNRVSTLVTYRNLVIVFVLTGIWHGANWTFLVWGMYHGGMLIVERVTGLATLPADRYVVPRRVATMLLVVFGWVLFRADSLHQAGMIMRHMVTPSLTATSQVLVGAGISRQAVLILVLALLVVLLPRDFVAGRYLQQGQGRLVVGARYGVSILGAGYAAILVAAGTFSPFLYYQF